MATRALDIATLLHALTKLHSELKVSGWITENAQQQEVLAWLNKYRAPLAKLTGLDSKASRFWEELNEFLQSKGFDPLVEPFDSDNGIGVVSTLEKLIKWINGPADKVEILTELGARAGFEIPYHGVNIYTVSGYPNSHLLELMTASKDTMWLFDHDNDSLDGLDLVTLSFHIMSQPRSVAMNPRMGSLGSYPAYAGARIPNVGFDVTSNLRWLEGLGVNTFKNGIFYVTQATQQFKLNINREGAKVKTATVISASRGGSQSPRVFIVDGPFYGWLTQNDLFPMAAFYADWDSIGAE